MKKQFQILSCTTLCSYVAVEVITLLLVSKTKFSLLLAELLGYVRNMYIGVRKLQSYERYHKT